MLAFPLINDQPPPEGIHVTTMISLTPIRFFVDLPAVKKTLSLLECVLNPPSIEYDQVC